MSETFPTSPTPEERAQIPELSDIHEKPPSAVWPISGVPLRDVSAPRATGSAGVDLRLLRREAKRSELSRAEVVEFMRSKPEAALPLPERGEGEEASAYLRRIYELTPQEKDNINADCAALVTKATRMYGHEAHAAAVNDTDFLKWRFMGEPNDPLPRVIDKNRIYVWVSFDPELVEIQNKQLTRIRKIAKDNKETVAELVCEDVKKSPQYAFLASFIDIPEQAVQNDVPLAEIVKETNTANRKGKLSEEYGIDPGKIDTTWSPAAFAIKQELRHFYFQQDLLTTRQRQPEAKAKDPFLRLSEWSTQKANLMRQTHPTGSQSVSNTINGLPDILTREEIDAQFPPEHNDIPNINTIVENMIRLSFQNDRTESYDQSLEEEVREICYGAVNDLTRYYCVDVGKSTLANIMWLRKPRYIEHKPKPFLKQNTGNSMLDNETMEALNAVEVAHITRHEYSRGYEEKTRLIFWEEAATLPEVADAKPSLTLHFPSSAANGEAQNFIPGNMDPFIPGYTIIAAREMAGGREFDFAESENDPYEPCDVSVQHHQQSLGNYFDQAEGGLMAIAGALREQTDGLTIDQLTRTIQNESEYGTVDGQISKKIVVLNGVAYMQCLGAGELFSKAINEVCGQVSYVVKGLAMVPGEDTVTLLGHAQVVFTDNEREYLCDATPAMRTQPLNPNYSDVFPSTQINDHDLLDAISSIPATPSPVVYEANQGEHHFIEQYQVAPAEEASTDLLVTARQIFNSYPQQLESNRSALENAIRVRLNLESDAHYNDREELYSHIIRLIPNDDHPVRMALQSAILAKVSIQEYSYISGDESRAKTQQALERIQFFQTIDPEIRAQESRYVDGVTLEMLKSYLEQQLRKQQDFAWARQTIYDA